MHEHETLVVLEALMKWEDKLLGRKFTVITIQRFIEIQSQVIRRSQRLQERTHTARLESQMLNDTFNNIPVE